MDYQKDKVAKSRSLLITSLVLIQAPGRNKCHCGRLKNDSVGKMTILLMNNSVDQELLLNRQGVLEVFFFFPFLNSSGDAGMRRQMVHTHTHTHTKLLVVLKGTASDLCLHIYNSPIGYYKFRLRFNNFSKLKVVQPLSQEKKIY